MPVDFSGDGGSDYCALDVSGGSTGQSGCARNRNQPPSGSPVADQAAGRVAGQAQRGGTGPLDQVLLEHGAVPVAGDSRACGRIERCAGPGAPQAGRQRPGNGCADHRGEVNGLSVGVSAHVSSPGYVPATPVPDPSAKNVLRWVTWLAQDQLLTVDKTEPNYDRIRVPRFLLYPADIRPGSSGCWLYVSRHGYLIGPSGEPRKLIDQAGLISSLLAEFPGLAELAGTSPKKWVSRVRNKRIRDDIRELFRTAGVAQSSGQDRWTS